MSAGTAEQPADVVVAVTARLEGLAEQDVGEHVAAYDDVHALLQNALAALDEG